MHYSVIITKQIQSQQALSSLTTCVWQCFSMSPHNVTKTTVLRIISVVLERDDGGMILGRLIKYPPVESVKNMIMLAHEKVSGSSSPLVCIKMNSTFKRGG